MKRMRFERLRQPLLPFREFRGRLLIYASLAAMLIAGSLAFGMAGYHWIAGLSWIDSLLNASMILTGMGPVSPMESTASKLFASFYAIFSGVMFLSSVGVLLAPVIHRFLHDIHLDAKE